MIDQEKRPKRRKKRHPAKAARRVALLASFTATGGIGAAMAYADHESEVETAAPEALDIGTMVEKSAIATRPTLDSELETVQDVVSSIVDSPAPALAAGYRDGTWLGEAEYTKWGDVQVQVLIEGGEVADIVMVQVPNDRKSTSINNVATPILEGQAIAIQGADLDIVSGATYTSRTYAASLQSALDQAQQVNEATTGVVEAAQSGLGNSGSAQEIALDS